MTSGGPPTTIRVLVVQNHPMLASQIVEILEHDTRLSAIATGTGAGAVWIAAHERVGVVVIDYRLPDMTGAAAARIIKAARPETAIVFHATNDSEAAMLDAINAGASAYLTSSATAEHILEAVRQASRGEVLIPVKLLARSIERQRNASKRQTVIAVVRRRVVELSRGSGRAGFKNDIAQPPARVVLSQ